MYKPYECPYVAVSSVIHYAKVRKKLSHARIAEGICSVASVSNWESGLSVPSEKMCRKLAVRFDRDVDSLIAAAAYDRQRLEEFKVAIRKRNYSEATLFCEEFMQRKCAPKAIQRYSHWLDVVNIMWGRHPLRVIEMERAR